MKSKRVYLLNRSPLVIAGSFATPRIVAKMGQPLTFIYHNPGWIRPRNLWRWLSVARPFWNSNKRILFVTNEPSEARWLRLVGLKAVCIGHNFHVRENFFCPVRDSQLEKDFDAVYAARISPQKRLHLATGIKRLNVVTYELGKSSWNLASSEPGLAHAASNFTFLPEEKVRDIYRRSFCGLALSASEGAMWASIEYLCCGLPVVTTPSRGGRDRYFDPTYVKTVPATSTAVTQAVTEWVAAQPDPFAIREKVLKLVRRDRIAYIELLRSQCGLDVADPAREIERLWGGEQGIEKHAVGLDDVHSL